MTNDASREDLRKFHEEAMTLSKELVKQVQKRSVTDDEWLSVLVANQTVIMAMLDYLINKLENKPNEDPTEGGIRQEAKTV